MSSADDILEREVERPAAEYGRLRGWLAFKNKSVFPPGFPDYTFIRPARTIYIEFKRPGEGPNPQQALRHRELRAAGQEVYVCDNLDHAKTILR